MFLLVCVGVNFILVVFTSLMISLRFRLCFFTIDDFNVVIWLYTLVFVCEFSSFVHVTLRIVKFVRTRFESFSEQRPTMRPSSGAHHFRHFSGHV